MVQRKPNKSYFIDEKAVIQLCINIGWDMNFTVCRDDGAVHIPKFVSTAKWLHEHLVYLVNQMMQQNHMQRQEKAR